MEREVDKEQNKDFVFCIRNGKDGSKAGKRATGEQSCVQRSVREKGTSEQRSRAGRDPACRSLEAAAPEEGIAKRKALS